MASVFLARDTRTDAVVALKVVHLGDDEEAKEILESEQRGVELQKEFSALSRYVPAVYDSGFATDYFYIAMEYIAGEDLSQAIHRGPLPWPRAVAITSQLCEFLEQADRFEGGAAAHRTLLHNDLKPRNIRLTNETTSNGHEVIKVLDFGAAKALSLSRKVTRNDFGSTAYLSPECLETGDRDRLSDAWALGVLLYEMVRGHQPYRAGDTRRLEQMIRARRPPLPVGGRLPDCAAGGDRQTARAVPAGSLRDPGRHSHGPRARAGRRGFAGARGGLAARFVGRACHAPDTA
jgi:serine/threonine-protein kinase